MRDRARTTLLSPLRLERARQRLWDELTGGDRAAARQTYASLMRMVTEPGVLRPLQAVRGTTLLQTLFLAITVLRRVRWVLYAALTAAGLALHPWFCVGVPLVFLLDRGAWGYLHLRLGIELAARVYVFNDFTLEDPISARPGPKPGRASENPGDRPGTNSKKQPVVTPGERHGRDALRRAGPGAGERIGTSRLTPYDLHRSMTHVDEWFR